MLRALGMTRRPGPAGLRPGGRADRGPSDPLTGILIGLPGQHPHGQPTGSTTPPWSREMSGDYGYRITSRSSGPPGTRR
ncbi:MAG: hypothetical protein MZU95_07800 [Desulfomicrobium escambiense]|nr:hypothetical protein [Desulfomicrobium escambiense]